MNSSISPSVQSPIFLNDDLGIMKKSDAIDSLKQILKNRPALQFNDNIDFTIEQQWIDSLNKLHTRFNQTIHQLKVYGTNMLLHADVSPNNIQVSDPVANIYALNGTLAVDSYPSVTQKILKHNDAGADATKAAQKIGQSTSKPELAFIFLESGQTKICWRIEVSWDNGAGDFGRDDIFFDTQTAEILTRHPKIQTSGGFIPNH
ncbi:hypothetical protein [Aliikangiella maris]|uniref:PepSY domain-containing protein n=2 Tax=Aliikangiella maris TaxID=3162458 RepID=A0ABV2BZS8_9GAMM